MISKEDATKALKLPPEQLDEWLRQQSARSARMPAHVAWGWQPWEEYGKEQKRDLMAALRRNGLAPPEPSSWATLFVALSLKGVLEYLGLISKDSAVRDCKTCARCVLIKDYARGESLPPNYEEYRCKSSDKGYSSWTPLFIEVLPDRWSACDGIGWEKKKLEES